MRRHPVAVRMLISGAAVVLLMLVASLPSRLTSPLEAHPQFQGSPLITPATAAQSTSVGSTISYNFTLTNSGPDPDTFSVQVLPAPGPNLTGVNATPSTSSIRLAANTSATFGVIVTVAADAQTGQDVRTVQVTSTTDSSIVGRAVITTTVTAPTATPTASATPTNTPGPTATAGPLCKDTFEPDNDPGSAKELRPDLGQTHAICPGGDQDWYFFGGLSGKVVTIDVPVMANGLDLSLSLYDAAGNLLAFNDDFPRNNDPTDIKPRIQSWRVPANGRYYIRVRDAAGGGGTDLSYNIVLTSESYGPTPTLIPELCTDLFEPDGVPEQARLITIREVQPNHRLCPSGDADWIKFFAKAGARFALYTDSHGRAGADTVMVLTDRDGVTILDFNDDSGGTLDSRIEFTPTVDGFYFAQVKNVGDIGNQFIAYDFHFDPLGVTSPTTGPATPTVPSTFGTPTIPPFATPGTATPFGTPGTTTPTITPGGAQVCPTAAPYPPGCATASSVTRMDGPKGQPPYVNGPAKDFIDPAFAGVWSRTDQVVASRQADRTWMWGPSGLFGRAELYQQANGGARQVQYFDKARMEITDWQRDRSNPWFVTNGLLVREMVEGRVQIGDAQFLSRVPAQIGIAGDADDRTGPTYASFARLLGPAGDRVGQTATAMLRRDGSTAPAAGRPEARLQTYVPETGHNIAQVFWDFLQQRGPVGDGKSEDTLVDWVFAMGYPISEPYWARVKVGGVEQDVLMQAFQRRVLTYTPSNPSGWQVEMGNVGRHYYTWRYGRQP